MDNKQSTGFWGYKAAVGAFLVIFVNLGVCSTLGVFLSSLAEYSEWDLGTVGYIGTFNTVANVILSIVAVKFIEKLGPKVCMIISILACALHVNLYCFATPGANVQSLAFMYAAGVVASVAITFGTHAVCSTVISQWFISKRAQIIGIVFSGAGFGAAIWVFLAGQLFQFMDYKGSYRVISVLTLIIGAVAITFIRDPEKMGQKPLGADEEAESGGSEAAPAAELPGVTKDEATKTPAFWLLACALLCVCSAGSCFMAYAPAWWQACGWSSTAASNWDALFLVLSGVVLLGVGKVTSMVKSSAFVAIVCIAYVISAAAMYMLGTSPTTVMILATVIFGALAYPLQASIPGLMGQSIFGARDAGAISATLMTPVYLGQALYAPIMAFFLAGEGGMANGWMFFGAAVLVGMVFMLVAIANSPVKEKK